MSMMMKRITKRADLTKNSLGVRCAAGYLRNQGVSLEVALGILFARKD